MQMYPLSKWVVSHTLFDISQQTIDEIAQETMISLASGIDRITDEVHLKRFVRRTARNKCIDYIRRNRQQFTDLPEDLSMEESDPLPEDPIVDALHEAVGELKEPCRTIIRTRYLLNLSYRDIAARSGIGINQIGVRLKRCLAFLKDLLKYKNISAEDFR